MFLFENISWQAAVMWFVVLGVLIIVNELARRSLLASLFLFLFLPIILTVFVWPHSAGEGSSTGTWFHWMKVYSALAGCIGFLAIRFVKGWSENKYILMFPAIILEINILEAVIRDFEVYNLNGMVDGVMMIGGPWNIINGIAGIINIITITGWMGIVISKDKYKDMVWPDMLWFWIIAYDLWNFAYVYNCVSDHSFYAGAALLISCTIPAFFIKKGAWLQHRAQTLALWMMFTMSFPMFVSDSIFTVQSSHNTTALWTMSVLALLANVGVLIYQIYTIFIHKRNPFKEELYIDLAAYKRVAEENKTDCAVEKMQAV